MAPLLEPVIIAEPAPRLRREARPPRRPGRSLGRATTGEGPVLRRRPPWDAHVGAGGGEGPWSLRVCWGWPAMHAARWTEGWGAGGRGLRGAAGVCARHGLTACREPIPKS